MAVNLSFIGGAGWQFLDNSGNPLTGGKIYTYAAGTTVPQVTYTSRTGATPNTNPIILDAAGRTPEQIWSTEGLLYKYVVTTSTDVVIRTWDNIGGSVVASDLQTDLANTTDVAKGDAMVGFRQSNASGILTGAVARTVHQKLQETVSVKDFGATGDGVVANEGPFIQAAIDALEAAGGGIVFVPKGTYKLTQTIVLKPGVSLIGEGSDVTIFDKGTAGGTVITTPSVSATTLTQTTSLLPGQTSNTITNTCQPGDFIQYQNNNMWTDRWAERVVRSYYYEAELFEVKSATGSSVVFTEGAVANCPVATTKNVEFFTPSSYITIKGLTLRKSASVINYSNGLYVYRCKYVWIDDIATENFDSAGINISQSMYVNVGSTKHIGGSDTLGLNYGTVYTDGTKHAVHTSIFGKNNRHTFASGGSGYAIPMYVTLLSGNITESQDHSVDCHSHSAYFTINNVNADNGMVVSGLGHKVANCVSNALASNCMPYGGGQAITYKDITICGKRASPISVYTNENIIESTFENINISATNYYRFSFRTGSVRNVFKNWRVVCSSIATATSSANADTFLTASSQGTGGLLKNQCVIDGLYMEGFPSPIVIAYPDCEVMNVFLQDCGWTNSFTTTDAAIRLAQADRSLVFNVSIYNKNSNLTWNSRSIRIDPGVATYNITIQNVWDGLTPVGNVNYYISFVDGFVYELFLQNIRLRNGGGGNSFSAVSGKYIYQTLTVDN